MGKLNKGNNDLLSVAPNLAVEWHPTKNGNLTPSTISAKTNIKIWWVGVCGHEWESRLSDRVMKNSSCPYCSRRKILVGFNDLATTHPELVKQLAKTQPDNISATQIMAGTNKKALWVCEKGHEWLSIVRHRVNGSNCPYCSGRKVAPGENDLFSQFPKIASEWHPTRNKNLTPSQIVSGSTKKVWWECKNNHEWETKIVYRTTENSSCPQCVSPVSKQEKELREYVKTINVTNSLVFNDRKILQGQELDIYIPEQKLAIEFNGLYWHSETAGKTRNYHYDKWLTCRDKGIQLIQVWEDDWRDKNMFVKKELKAMLEQTIKIEPTIHALSQEEINSFMVANNIIDPHVMNTDIRIGSFIDNEITSVLCANFITNQTLKITKYVSFKHSKETFIQIIKYVTELYNITKVIGVVSNATYNNAVYSQTGFYATKLLSPSYMFLANRKRTSFHELNENQLQQLSKYPKIWDAGCTVWVKKFNPK